MSITVNRALRVGSRVNGSTTGSVLVIDANGKLAQDNANLFWDDVNNRLGIGTASPQDNLHIRDTSGTAIISLGSRGGDDNRWQLKNRNSGSWLGIGYESGSFAEHISIGAISGNVGIGTPTPDELLHVVGSGNVKLEIESSDTNAYLVLNSHTNEDAILELQEESVRRWIVLNDGADSNKFEIRNEDTDTKFTIQQVGNVGIGEASPSAKLHVLNTDKQLVLEKAPAGYFTAQGYDGNDPYYTYYSATGLLFGYGESTGNPPTVDTLFLSNAGNVGIGTASPNEKLTLAHSSMIGWEYSTGDSNVYHYIGKPTDGVGALEFWNDYTNTDTAKIFSFYSDDGSTEIVTFLEGGNVGIGTTAPGSKLQVVGISRFGEDTTNYSEFESDGTLEFNGTAKVYDDQQVTLGQVKLGSSAPTWTDYKGSQVLAFSKSQDNKIYFTCQLSHKYCLESTISFHVHSVASDDTAGDVTWTLTYSWADIDADYPAESTSSNEQTIVINSADKHLYHVVDGAISGTGKTGVSSVLLCSLERTGTAVADDYDNDIYLAALDFHFEVDTVGSRTISAK